MNAIYPFQELAFPPVVSPENPAVDQSQAATDPTISSVNFQITPFGSPTIPSAQRQLQHNHRRSPESWPTHRVDWPSDRGHPAKRTGHHFGPNDPAISMLLSDRAHYELQRADAIPDALSLIHI